MLTDLELLLLYGEWSERCWAAGFLSPSPHTVTEFLDDLLAREPSALKDYEQDFLDEARRQLAILRALAGAVEVE